MRRAWHIGRWALVAVLLPALVALQLAIAWVYLVPVDRDELLVTRAPLVLVDVHGEVIVTLPAAGGDRTHWTALGDVPAIAVSAVVESEDERFWDHRGVDALGVARAAWLDAKGAMVRRAPARPRVVFGGSTLTMQLARMLEGNTNDRTLVHKASETLYALRLERALGKREILEQWLNRAYFGNGAYGFEAAAQLYFGKSARVLSAGEATLLAVLPRAPQAYDPLVHLAAAIARRDRVVALMAARGVITEALVREVQAEPIAVARHEPANAAPHFTRWVLEQIPPDVRAAGGIVHTTLDLRLQRVLERRVREQVATLRHRNVAQAGMVVLDAQTSAVRAMVGSTSWDESQINITTRRRNPGSALKPFVYAAAIEQGASPSTIAWDIRDTAEDYFSPGGGVEHGPVRYREALASSYNFAAVSVLDEVGIPRVMSLLRAAGVAELPGAPDDYGLRLALGAAKVRLVDLAAGYGFLVRGGAVSPAGGVVDVELPDGRKWWPAGELAHRVVSPQTAWLVMDMLSDPEARRPGFGMELPFDLPFKIAAKTGTARGFADTWTVAATNEVIVGAWAGTFDGTSMQGLVGMDAAAPLVRDAMLTIADGHKLTLPARPDGIVDVTVCADTGMPDDGRCPTIHDYTTRGALPRDPGITRDASGALHYPPRAANWLRRR